MVLLEFYKSHNYLYQGECYDLWYFIILALMNSSDNCRPRIWDKKRQGHFGLESNGITQGIKASIQGIKAGLKLFLHCYFNHLTAPYPGKARFKIAMHV